MFNTFTVAMSYSVAVWSYYLATDTVLTSIAHFAAVTLGVLIGYCLKYFILLFDQDESNKTLKESSELNHSYSSIVDEQLI